MNDSSIALIKITENEEPYVKASDLSKHLGFKELDQVSRIVRRRPEDFSPNEAFVGDDGIMYLNYDGSIKVCMFATTDRSRAVREEITEVYKAWRNGEIYANTEVTKVEQAFMLAKAVMRIAEAQMEMEKKINEQDRRIGKIEEKIEILGIAANSKSFITEEQATEISLLVKMTAQALSEKTGKNKYATVYAELYRRFSITTYKNIPQDKYADVMKWLSDYHSSALNGIK